MRVVVDTHTHRFEHLVDDVSRPYLAYVHATRWLALRLDLISIIITALVSLFVVMATVFPQTYGNLGPTYAGLILVYSIQASVEIDACGCR